MKPETLNKEKTIIVGLQLYDEPDIEDSMDELEELVKAAGGVVVFRIIQKKKIGGSSLFYRERKGI